MLCVTVVPVPDAVEAVPAAVVETVVPEAGGVADSILGSVPLVTVAEPEVVALLGGAVGRVATTPDGAVVALLGRDRDATRTRTQWRGRDATRTRTRWRGRDATHACGQLAGRS